MARCPPASRRTWTHCQALAVPAKRWSSRHWRVSFVLLALTLLPLPAYACSIQRSDPTTVTIRGYCEKTVLVSQLSVAINALDEDGGLGRQNTGTGSGSGSGSGTPSGASSPRHSKKIDLVNGYVKGNRSTFFHRSGVTK